MKLGQSDPRNRVKTERTDRAVSPVIGVILMVAITVILAAVIGVFVLGLGDELGEASPSNSLTVEGEVHVDTSTEDNLSLQEATVSLDTGDSFSVDDIRLVVREDGTNLETIESDDLEPSEGQIEVGDSLELADSTETFGDYDEDASYTLEVVHTPSDSIIGDGELEVDEE